jgi:hypothetical protein
MVISASVVRTALISYRGELLKLSHKYPDQFKDCGATIDKIDDVLLSIEGNITAVTITPATCNSLR